jgi:hypothetical protein
MCLIVPWAANCARSFAIEPLTSLKGSCGGRCGSCGGRGRRWVAAVLLIALSFVILVIIGYASKVTLVFLVVPRTTKCTRVHATKLATSLKRGGSSRGCCCSSRSGWRVATVLLGTFPCVVLIVIFPTRNITLVVFVVPRATKGTRILASELATGLNCGGSSRGCCCSSRSGWWVATVLLGTLPCVILIVICRTRNVALVFFVIPRATKSTGIFTSELTASFNSGGCCCSGCCCSGRRRGSRGRRIAAILLGALVFVVLLVVIHAEKLVWLFLVIPRATNSAWGLAVKRLTSLESSRGCSSSCSRGGGSRLFTAQLL